ncbi:hypothetical protein ACTFAO_07590 [Sphingobacterium spiritivorum]|uniref:hypothetical protein n=1 Tax=Sphingobacterium spiritivorum TaxID=258 RepID=UPI003F763CCD
MNVDVTKSQLSTKSLIKLKEALPKGYLSTISENFNLSKSTISRILDGKIENFEVVNYAIELVKQKRNTIDALENKINAFIK